jgi:hypothetical protein
LPVGSSCLSAPLTLLIVGFLPLLSSTKSSQLLVDVDAQTILVVAAYGATNTGFIFKSTPMVALCPLIELLSRRHSMVRTLVVVGRSAYDPSTGLYCQSVFPLVGGYFHCRSVGFFGNVARFQYVTVDSFGSVGLKPDSQIQWIGELQLHSCDQQQQWAQMLQ